MRILRARTRAQEGLASWRLRDPGFVSSLKSGRSLRLDTADRLLEFMNEAPIGPTFRSEVEAFLSRTGTQPYKLGSDAVGDSSFVTRLRSGASPGLRTVERVRRWDRAPVSSAQVRSPSQRAALAGEWPRPGTIPRSFCRHARPRPC